MRYVITDGPHVETVHAESMHAAAEIAARKRARRRHRKIDTVSRVSSYQRYGWGWFQPYRNHGTAPGPFSTEPVGKPFSVERTTD